MNTKFFLLFLSLILLSCHSNELQGDASQKPHSKEDWIKFRSQELKISLAEAQSQEENLSESEPPEEIWDASLQTESAILWRNYCATCHGVTGQLENVPEQDPMPRKFGTFGMSMGFFFGGDKMRAGIYKAIKTGKKSDGTVLNKMPAWGESFSKEQLWGLVFFIKDL
ncbi:MAG: cytochrome c [Planctomycetota bacterium]